ncbi:type III secretion system chaperone [Ramlibacter sp. AW1]|uniref:Type III secretion system chaperone n=1 Tax=Ramlibacter aurantiacus TaxID=2801330 RepID=A0A936ZVC7_9BURK|nr:type III secretion system chaperone [Ramlibacter aurantiacus]MBL0421259.1 type III secretion system chaperone [Ramlibacter aurantiacus]
MISSQSHEAPAEDSGPSFAAEMEQMDEHLHNLSSKFFEAMLPRVVERMVGPGDAAREALANGGFVLNDCTVVMRLNAETDSVEFFCDVGLPRPPSLHQVYRAALEHNLCRTYPGIVLGIHPESGRLVATAASPAMLVGNDEVCIETLQMLTGVVTELRAQPGIDVEL